MHFSVKLGRAHGTNPILTAEKVPTIQLLDEFLFLPVGPSIVNLIRKLQTTGSSKELVPMANM